MLPPENFVYKDHHLQHMGQTGEHRLNLKYSRIQQVVLLLASNSPPFPEELGKHLSQHLSSSQLGNIFQQLYSRNLCNCNFQLFCCSLCIGQAKSIITQLKVISKITYNKILFLNFFHLLFSFSLEIPSCQNFRPAIFILSL